jgi:hypothetical protein
MEAATRVAVCEEGGWSRYGYPAYPDSLGISAVAWNENGGLQCAVPPPPQCQIAVAARIQPYPPDQSGCAPW